MVVPIILGVAVAVCAIGWLVTWYRSRPTKENETMDKIEEELRLEEKRKENERRHKERMEELRLEREKLAAEKRKADKEAAEAAAERQKRIEKRKMKTSQDVKEMENEAELLKTELLEHEKQVKAEQQRLKEYEVELKKKQEAFEEEARKAREQAEAERVARLQMENGLQPIKWPTREEFERGRDLIQYSKHNLHFAIVGKSGSGKSSLINAFLNCSSGQIGAAATGITETTSTISRYPDPGEQAPRPWTVWYDVPGAGTQNVSAWQYFINQGLFVFDIILIAIGDRFEETDVQLLRDCARFKIPSLIVRSKADMHIDNLVKDEDGWGETNNPESYQRCRDRFITESRQMVRDELTKARLPEQDVYLVSSYTLRKVYNRSLDGLESDLPEKMIDEKNLIRAIMLLTIQRRGDDGALQAAVVLAMGGEKLRKKTVQAGRKLGNGIQAAKNWTLDALRPQSRPINGGDAIAHEVPQIQQVRQPEEGPRNEQPHNEAPIYTDQNRNITWIKRVIYLPKPTKSDLLQREIDACNRKLAGIFAAPPRMLSTKTAVLNFLPGVALPDVVLAFGKVLGLKPYREKPKDARQNKNPYWKKPRAEGAKNNSPGMPDVSPSKNTYGAGKQRSGYRNPTIADDEDDSY